MISIESIKQCNHTEFVGIKKRPGVFEFITAAFYETSFVPICWNINYIYYCSNITLIICEVSQDKTLGFLFFYEVI